MRVFVIVMWIILSFYRKIFFPNLWRHSPSPSIWKSLEDSYLRHISPSSWFEITLLSATKEKFTSLVTVTRYNQKLRQRKSAGELMEMSLTLRLLEAFLFIFIFFWLTKNVFAGKDLRSERSHFLELSKSSVGHSYYRLEHFSFIFRIKGFISRCHVTSRLSNSSVPSTPLSPALSSNSHLIKREFTEGMLWRMFFRLETCETGMAIQKCSEVCIKVASVRGNRLCFHNLTFISYGVPVINLYPNKTIDTRFREE